jgi:hypothetical protein
VALRVHTVPDRATIRDSIVFLNHQAYNTELLLAPAGVQMQMLNKHNLALCVDQELIEKPRRIGFNLTETFEDRLEHLTAQFASVDSVNNNEMNSNQGS